MNLSKVKDVLIKFLQKAWSYIKVARVELILLAAVLVVDLTTKAIMESALSGKAAVTVIPNFLNFNFIYNDMAAFGSAFGLEKILSKTAIRVIFIILTFVAVGLFGWLLYKSRGKSKLKRFSLALIISGALGNLVDRIFIGAVRDFVEIVFFGLDIPLLGKTFAIFNIADAALVVGVIMFLVFILFFDKESKENKEAADEQSMQAEAVTEIKKETMAEIEGREDTGIDQSCEVEEKAIETETVSNESELDADIKAADSAAKGKNV